MTDTEINEAVARKLGIVKMRLADGAESLPNFCRDIGAAFEIVEHLRSNKGEAYVIEIKISGSLGYQCRIGDCASWCEASADPVAMAICLAFLKVA